MSDAQGSDEIFGMDARQLDASYKPFPTFEEWAKTGIDNSRWDAFTSETDRYRQEASQEQLERAQEIVERAAAVDTGAIEGLYEVDRGFTLTVARQAVAWELAIDQKGEGVRALFDSQLAAYNMVLDFATQQAPIAEAWIRQLHAEVCRSQDTYLVQTPQGPQSQELPKGQYKHLPNHVRGRDDKVHAYAPVDLTPEEMHRLCTELESDAFQRAHPVIQASYAHYAFVVIHPFADGNGRVARALASVYTYRSHSVPLLILADTRAQYISALEAADNGNFQPFVDFVVERALDGIQLVKESMDAATAPKAQDAIASLEELYTTKGGYTHEEIDNAGFLLYEAFTEEVTKHVNYYAEENHVHVRADTYPVGSNVGDERYRTPIASTRSQGIQLTFSSTSPAAAAVRTQLRLEVPKDANEQVGPVIRSLTTQESFEARVEEMVPIVSAAVRMRLSMFVERLFGSLLSELSKLARAEMEKQGYQL